MKNIVVNIKEKSHLYEDYNYNVSKNLIEYLINETKKVKGDIKIIINTSIETDELQFLITEGLQKALNESKRMAKIYDNRQLLYFIIGIIFMFISRIISFSILKEILLIAGTVPIWEALYISIDDESTAYIRRKCIKKLLNSEIEVIKI